MTPLRACGGPFLEEIIHSLHHNYSFAISHTGKRKRGSTVAHLSPSQGDEFPPLPLDTNQNPYSRSTEEREKGSERERER